jgi:multiple sugar transport system substrate-binding protein
MLRMAGGSALAGAGAILLGSCQPAQPAPAPVAKEEAEEKPAEKKEVPAAEKVTITYWDWWNMTAGNSGKMFEYLPKGFAEVEPDIELNLQNVPFGEYFRKFMAAHAAGDVPDTMHSSVYWGRDFYDKGALLDMMPYMEQTDDARREDFLPGALFQSSKGPVQYGVPGEGPDHQSVYFDIDMFEEAGLTTDLKEIEENWDWNTFTEAAKELTIMEGDEVKRSGFLVYVPETHSLSTWPACHGGSFYKPDEAGVAFNDNDATVHGLHWHLDMLFEAKVSQPIGPERQDWQQWLQGTTAMTRNGPWAYNQVLDQAPDKRWSCMLWPKAPYPGGVYSTNIWNNMLVIPTKAEKKDAGWKLLHYWCGLHFMLKRLEFGQWLAPRKDFYDTKEYEDARKALPVLDNVPLAGKIGKPLTFAQRTAIAETVQPIMEAVMLREREVEEAVDEMVEGCNELLEKAGYL